MDHQLHRNIAEHNKIVQGMHMSKYVKVKVKVKLQRTRSSFQPELFNKLVPYLQLRLILSRLAFFLLEMNLYFQLRHGF